MGHTAMNLSEVDRELAAERAHRETVYAEAADAWEHDQTAVFHGAVARIARSTAMIETLLDRRYALDTLRRTS